MATSPTQRPSQQRDSSSLGSPQRDLILKLVAEGDQRGAKLEEMDQKINLLMRQFEDWPRPAPRKAMPADGPRSLAASSDEARTLLLPWWAGMGDAGTGERRLAGMMWSSAVVSALEGRDQRDTNIRQLFLRANAGPRLYAQGLAGLPTAPRAASDGSRRPLTQVIVGSGAVGVATVLMAGGGLLAAGNVLGIGMGMVFSAILIGAIGVTELVRQP